MTTHPLPPLAVATALALGSAVSMMLLNGLLAIATALPVLSAHPLAVFVSGALFGSVFLSVVASTTALVRHNLPAAAWPIARAVCATGSRLASPRPWRVSRR